MRAVALDGLKDAKTLLQEHLQALRIDLPVYETIATSGADHAMRFTVQCSVPSLDVQCSATASSRRGAEKASAALVLDALGAATPVVETGGRGS